MGRKTESAFSPSLWNSLFVITVVYLWGWAFDFSAQVFPTSHMFGFSWGQLALLFLLLGVLLWAIVYRFQELYELFCSVHFAAVIGVVLALLTGAGTLIKQNVPLQELVATYGRKGAQIIQNLHFHDIFGSTSFLTLMVLLCLGLIGVSIRKKQYRIELLGFLMMHLGVVFLLIGGWIGRSHGLEGRLRIREGHQKNFVIDRTGKPRYLDFDVKLEDFSIKYYEEDRRIYAYKYAKGDKHGKSRAVASYGIHELEEQERRIPHFDYKVKVRKYYRKLRWEPFVEELPASRKDAYPLVKVTYSLHGKKETKYLSPQYRPMSVFPLERKVLLFVSQTTPPKGFEKDYVSGPIAEVHRVYVLSDRKGRHYVDVKVGKEHALSKEISLKVLKFLPHFVMDKKGSRTLSHKPKNPAILVEVKKKGKVAGRFWLFSNFPNVHSDQLKKLGLSLRYAYLPPSHGFERYLLFVLDRQEWWALGDGKILQKGKFSTPLEWKKLEFQLLSVEPTYGRLQHRPVEAKDGKGVEAVEVEIREGDKVLRRGLITAEKGSFLMTPRGDMVLQFAVRKEVKSYRSLVSIYEGRRKVLQKLVTVNDPLWYKGYAFYQSSYEGEHTSIFQVIYDPGLWLVFFGLFLTALGVPYVFYVQPLLRARKKRKLQQELLKERVLS